MSIDTDVPKMDYEEMIDTLKDLVFGTFDRTTAKEREALDMAIYVLSAESKVLEDIKAEIKDETYNTSRNSDYSDGLAKALEIIDKHISGKDCCDCIEWKTCPCGEKGHKNGTSKGYSIGECRDFKHISGKETDENTI